MAKQLNLLATGQIIPTALHQEMERSYLEYAMSVIVGRALPDVRDGLKPVHRRILYAMYELGLTPDRPYRKCARVVGDVLGKYHPHGDQAVYDALVRMVQVFASRYPLLSGHGNFGSVDNDPAAAMRYTETRLAGIGHDAVLEGISEAIVDFTNNFDNSSQEPVVLPAQLPILLLNGCAGIAVGMATNVPPHNLGEIVEGLIALIDRPDLPDEKLWEIIPGPDFPTGGEIIDNQGIKEAYRTGRGIIPVRGVTKIETISLEGRRPKERTAIVVTELPYQVNKAAWIEKIADLVNQGRLEGIADIRDESDRQGMRVVIELKKDSKPQAVLKSLYRQTALQSNFGAILLALVDNKPCQLSLRQLLEEFLNFREQTLNRQYSHELEEAQHRLHLLAGLLIALNNLDAVIEILRNAIDGSTAKLGLQAQLNLSVAQCDSILAMPMRRLTGLERQKLQTEYEQLQQRIHQLQTLLSDRNELMKSLKKELRSLKRKFADPRRTRIITTKKSRESDGTSDQQNQIKTVNKAEKRAKKLDNGHLPPSKSRLISENPNLTLFTPQPPPEDGILVMTYQGDIYWRYPQINRVNTPSSPDFPIYQETIRKREQLIVITNQGKAYAIAAQDIPPQESKVQGLTLLPKSAQRDSETIIKGFMMPEPQKRLELILLSQNGRIKRLPIAELTNLSSRGLSVMKLKDQDVLSYVAWAKEGQQVAIATTGGRVLRFIIDDQLPIMGRNTAGNPALRLRYDEKLVGCVILNEEDNLLLISQQGYGKRLP
jgi:DNA gyrase subunit A